MKKYNISFDFSKPIELTSYLFEITGLKSDDIVLDIFAGSASTAHSVLDFNFNNNLNLKFITVQLPEKLEKNEFKTIADLGKERIRRVIKQISSDISKEEKNYFLKKIINLTLVSKSSNCNPQTSKSGTAPLRRNRKQCRQDCSII